jgi:carbonic anhydrase
VKTLKNLFDNNKIWSEKVKKKKPTFFSELAKEHSPEYVWIGCSDSRVPVANTVGLLPGEIFVHRNIANLVIRTDLNCMSVLQYAVEFLRVKHIIVCGHYGCGGIRAALENKGFGLINDWLRHIQDVAKSYEHDLSEIADFEKKYDKLCELNVIEQVLNVAETTIVQDAWNRGQVLRLHGWIYDIADGSIGDLGVHLENLQEFETFRKRTLP